MNDRLALLAVTVLLGVDVGLAPTAPGSREDIVTPATAGGGRVHSGQEYDRNNLPGSHWQYTPGVGLRSPFHPASCHPSSAGTFCAQGFRKPIPVRAYCTRRRENVPDGVKYLRPHRVPPGSSRQQPAHNMTVSRHIPTQDVRQVPLVHDLSPSDIIQSPLE